MLVAPHRVRLSRERGYRKPSGSIVVARPTKWGNPFLLSDVSRRFPSLDADQCAGFVVNEFRDLMGSELLRARHNYPDPAEIRAVLAGFDLACWCPLNKPCHADVLLEVANPTEEPTHVA